MMNQPYTEQDALLRMTICGGEARVLLMAEFPGYVVCVTHLSLSPEDQRASLPIIRQATDTCRKPVLLAGDFNTGDAAAVLAVTIPAKDLLHAMQKIELDLGRVRPAGVHNAPRTIDLDIELFGDSPIDEPPELVVPHPRMHERRFVLELLHEIRPDAVIPGLGPAVRFLTLVQDQRLDKISDFHWKGA